MTSRNPIQMAPDAVDPTTVPTFTLDNGNIIPAVGLGTFGSDHASPQEIAEAVRVAASVGYRHFDCAAVYANEREVGVAFQDVMAGGIRRQDLWITSKLWNDKHAAEDVIPTCKRSMADLQVDYLDLYLVHWPFPNAHPPGCDVETRAPDARPYIHENYMKTWRQMEKLVETGLVRNIGTSNMTVPKLKLVLRDAKIKPACNEMELHPHFQQPELFEFACDNGIVPIGYSPIGSPNRPERDRAPDDTVDIEDPVLIEIAKSHSIHPALVCLKWGVQRGQVVIPMSTKRSHILTNLKCITEDPLTDKEMAALAGVDKICRLIKGQVFLWKDDQSWEALWDLDDEITPP